MRMHRNDIPVTLEAPGAIARQAGGFGDPAVRGRRGASTSLSDPGPTSPRSCGASRATPARYRHWGYVLSGEAVVTYGDGSEETCSGGDLFYWPPGHSVRVVADAEVILFSPQVEHAHVLEHMGAQMAAGGAPA